MKKTLIFLAALLTASHAMAGQPAPTATAPIAISPNNDISCPTCAVSSNVVNSFNGRHGTVTPQSGDYAVSQVTGAAPLASPTFTGTVGLPAGQVVNGVTLTSGGSTSNFLNADGTYTVPPGSVAIGGTISGGTVGDWLYVATGPVLAQATPEFAMSKISSGIFIDPRSPTYGAKCDGAVWSSSTGRPIQQGSDNDTAAFIAAAQAANLVGGMVIVPDGCWISDVAAIPKGAVFVGQGWSPNYGYDTGTNGQPYTRPVLYVIGHPTFGFDTGGSENIAFLGFEVNAISDASAYADTTCIGSSTGSSGFGGKIFLQNMSLKGCNYGYGPSGGYVYTTSEWSDYCSNNIGMGGSTSDLLSVGDTFCSGSVGIDLENGSGGFVRIIGPRLEYLSKAITIEGTGGEVSIEDAQTDHIATCALTVSGAYDVTWTGGAMRWSGIDGSLTVTGAANNGSGLIRLTVNGGNSPPTANLVTNDKITVAGVTGTTEANGVWTLTVVDGTHIDLQSSAYVNAYVSGGYGGVWGKAAAVCGNGGNGVHFSNVGFYSGSWEGQPPAPAFIYDSVGANNDYIEFLGGVMQSIATAPAINYNSYSVAFANFETYGMPAHYHVDGMGTPVVRNDNSQLSYGVGGNIGIGTSAPNANAILDVSTSPAAQSQLIVPNGSTGGRPTGELGGIRFNTTTNALESWNGTQWVTVGATVINNYLGGLTLSNDATTPNTVIDVAVGIAASDDNTQMMNLPSAITKTVASTWAVGNANGCLDTGTVAASTWYTILEMADITTSNVDILCTANPASPVMPSGYTVKRRIGSILTDGSSHIKAFKQIGSAFYWATPILDVNTSSLGTTSALEALTIPTGVKVTPLCRFTFLNTDNSVILTSPDEADIAPTTAVPFTAEPGADMIDNTVASGVINASCPFLTSNTAAQIRARASAASTTLTVITRGWID